MSDTQAELKSFLKNPKQKVVLLQGPWGIGKTYFWKNFIKGELLTLDEQAYSYVSLFGASSIDQLKNMILAGASSAGKKEKDPILSASQQVQKLKRFFKGVEAPGSLGKAAGALLSNVVGSVQESLIRNYLICFDDLERKAPSLPIAEIMGLISNLKEQRDCRIVLICNEQELGDDIKEYERFREKVVDRPLSYLPPLRSNLAIIFPPHEVDSFETIFRDLPLNNIRIMQQSKWALEYFQPRVASYHAELQRSFRSQVVKLTCLYHGFATTVPIEKLEGHSWLLESMKKEEKLPYMAILRRIEFSSEPYDEHIIFALKNGYSDLDALSRVMDGLNAQHKNQDSIAEIRSIWNLITSNFQADINAIVTRAKEVLDRHCLDAPLDWISETVRLLKMADSSNWDTYMEKAVLNFIPEAHEELLSSVKTYSDSPKVTEAIEKRRMHLAEKLDIEGLLTAVAGSDSWNSADYSRLDQFADADFEKFFRETKQERLFKLLQTLDDRLTDNKNADAVSLRSKVRRVLTKIAADNKLNSFRVHHVVFRSKAEEDQKDASVIT